MAGKYASAVVVELSNFWGLREDPKNYPVALFGSGITPKTLLEALKVFNIEKELAGMQMSVILSICAIIR